MGMTGPVAVARVAVDPVLMGRPTVAQAVRGLTGVVRVENAVGRAAIRMAPQVPVVGQAEGAATDPVDVLLRNGWSNMQCVSTLMATESSAALNC